MLVKGSKKLLVLDFSAVADIDSAGIGSLGEVLRDLKETEIQFALSAVRGLAIYHSFIIFVQHPLSGNIKSLLLSDKNIGAEESTFFPTVADAVNSAKML
jgi:hypothetical protein